MLQWEMVFWGMSTDLHAVSGRKAWACFGSWFSDSFIRQTSSRAAIRIVSGPVEVAGLRPTWMRGLYDGHPTCACLLDASVMSKGASCSLPQKSQMPSDPRATRGPRSMLFVVYHPGSCLSEAVLKNNGWLMNPHRQSNPDLCFCRCSPQVSG